MMTIETAVDPRPISASNSDRHGPANRRNLVSQVAQRLTSSGDPTDSLRLARQLAEDIDWRVRHDVAFAIIPHLPAAELTWFAERLTTDCNAYVRRAAARMIENRRREARHEAQHRRKQTRVSRQIQKLESQTNDAVAKQMGRLCRRHGEELMAQVAHDLRSVTSGLKPAIHESINSRGSKRTRAVSRVKLQLALFDKLVGDLQNFSVPLRVERRTERLCPILEEAIKAARTGVEELGIDPSPVRAVLELNTGIVLPVARHLFQIALTNVIQNAYESFLIEGNRLRTGEIRIHAATASDRVRITVTDNGPGMGEDELSAISAFLPGRRNRTKPFSTGFGSAIAARNIAAHDGELKLQSCLGVGTQAIITLPLERARVGYSS